MGEAGAIPNTARSPPECYCVKMGSDVSQFNVSFIVEGEVTRQESMTTTSERETSGF